MHATKPEPSRPTFAAAIARALRNRCPACGQGRLLATYLKQVDACAVCGERYADIHSDDIAPWLTILTVGLIGTPIAVTVERQLDWPAWLSMTVWPLLALGLALALLPRAKAAIIATLWFTRAPGSEAG